MNIYEIAKLSGVAPSTVSKVVNNYSGVSDKTKKKVLKVIEENNYITNMNARNLKKKSNLLGVIMPTIQQVNTNSSFHARILNAFRTECTNKGYDVVFVSDYLLEKKVSYLEHCQYMNIAGVLIVAYNTSDGNVTDVIKSDIPVVSTHFRNNFDICEIHSDDRKGTMAAIDYLVSLGHKNIAYICGPEANSSSSLARLGGYVEAMRQNGLQVNDPWIKSVKKYRYEEGYRVMKEWLCEEKPLPSAIAIASDIIALGAMKAIREAGLNVPEDISIIGFDDHEMAAISYPELTTIRQDLEQIGKVAANRLIDITKGQEVNNKEIIPVQLIERHSCKDLNK